MKKLFFTFLLLSASPLFSQKDSTRKNVSSFYAGINYSVMKPCENLAGFTVGVQTTLRDTHLLAFEIDHCVNTDFKPEKCYGTKGEIKTETNYEITYGKVLFKTKKETKLIMQSGLRMQYLICQIKYTSNSVNYLVFDEPLYIKRSLWQPALPIKLSLLWPGKLIDKSFGVYANIGRYCDFGARLVILLGK